MHDKEDKSLLEQAAETRYPYVDGNFYFNALQNSKRSDFMDGAKWVMEKSQLLFPKCFEIIKTMYEEFEPVSEAEKLLYESMEQIFEEASKLNIYKKDLKEYSRDNARQYYLDTLCEEGESHNLKTATL